MNLPLKIKKESGLTLTELIITTILIAVVMVGIASMDVALRQSEKGTTRNALAAMRTNNLMFHIRKNLELATGDANNPGAICADSTGVICNPATGACSCIAAANLWIRIENPVIPVAARTINYNDDLWVMYRYNANSLFFCSQVTAGSNNPTTITNCPVGALEENLGPLVSFDVNPVLNRAAQEFYTEITLRNRIDPAHPADTFDNPEQVLTAKVLPLLSSF